MREVARIFKLKNINNHFKCKCSKKAEIIILVKKERHSCMFYVRTHFKYKDTRYKNRGMEK